MKSYTELEVWQKARELVKSIYSTTSKLPKEELFGLTNQMRRAAISIPSNIAEGCGRNLSKETAHFLPIARGSLYEMETQLYLSFDLNYINQEDFDQNLKKIVECRKLLSGFISYYKNKSTH